jgi:anti-sigma regulatory factor (Ser/Thr protein kinase)
VSVEQLAITVSADAESVFVVRHFVTAALPFLGVLADASTVALLTSELTANAVDLHAGEVTVTVSSVDDRVRVEVRDFGYGRPVVMHPDPVDPGGGRGLMIVQQMADGWGIDEFLPGKIVWFELGPRHQSGDGAVAAGGSGALLDRQARFSRA